MQTPIHLGYHDSDEEAELLYKALAPAHHFADIEGEDEVDMHDNKFPVQDNGLAVTVKLSKKRRKQLKKHRKTRAITEHGKHKRDTMPLKSEKKNKMSLQFSDSEPGLQVKEDVAQQISHASPTKRLHKSSSKSRIEKKEGFRISQLGNQPEIELQAEDLEEESWEQGKKKKKSKKRTIGNEEMVNLLKGIGVAEEENASEAGSYDNGLDNLRLLKSKRKGLRVSNKLFANLPVEDIEASEASSQTMQLQFGAKSNSTVSMTSSFLDKMEAVKKRFSCADVKKEEKTGRLQQQLVRSIVSLGTAMMGMEQHQQIDIDVRVPAITRGKSADLINNAFILNQMLREPTKQQPAVTVEKIGIALTHSMQKTKMTRQELFKMLRLETQFRRSKYLSVQDVLNKKTDLDQLEEERKRIQEKRRKDDMQSSEQEQVDQQIDRLHQLLMQEEEGRNPAYAEEQDVIEDNRNEEQEEEKRQEESENNKQDKARVEQENQSRLDEGDIGEMVDQLSQMKKEGDESILDEDSEDQGKEEEELAHSSEREEIEQQHNIEEGQGLSSSEQESVRNDSNEQILDKMEDQPMANVLMQPMQPTEWLEEGIGMKRQKKRNQNGQREEESRNIVMDSSVPPENSVNPQNSVSPDKDNDIRDPQEHNEQLKAFRKLRKIAQVVAQRRRERQKMKQRAKEYYDEEAEVGSDNEEHDDDVKQIDYAAEEQEYEGIDLDKDLQELIDNAVDINDQDEQNAFRKYLEDVKMQDREELKKILKGQFRQRREQADLEVEEDERNRLQRMDQMMQWISKREEDEGKAYYMMEKKDQDSEQQDENEAEGSEGEDEEMTPPEQQRARLESYLEDLMVVPKKESQPLSTSLFQLPDSIKQERIVFPSRYNISISRGPLPRLKKKSSHLNQLLGSSPAKKPLQKQLLQRVGRK